MGVSNKKRKILSKMATVEYNLSFNDLFSRISEPGRKALIEENCAHEIVFNRMTNDEIERFNFSEKDRFLVKLIAIQCRALKEKTRKPRLEMPKNAITDILPIKSKITLRALQKSGLLSPAKLYLLTSIDDVMKVFQKYSSIPTEDKQNIFAGMALGKYAAKYGKTEK